MLYVNDMTDNISSPVRLFADDTIVYREIKTQKDHEALQKDLETLFQWSKTWQMSFNVTKCYALRMTKRKKPSIFTYSMDGRDLEYVDSHPYLGVHFSDDLEWNKQVTKVTSKAKRTLGVVTRNLYDCSTEVKSRAYQALVRPIVEYASTAWYPYTEKNISQVESIQKQAARFCTGNYERLASVSAMQNDLGWLPLGVRRNIKSLTMFYKIHHNMVNINFPAYIQPKTRLSRSHPFCYHHLQASIDTRKYSFYVRTIPMWEVLPASAVLAPTTAQFQQLILPTVRSLPVGRVGPM